MFRQKSKSKIKQEKAKGNKLIEVIFFVKTTNNKQQTTNRKLFKI